MADHVAETPNKFIPSPKVRRYIYGVLAASGPLVSFYGLMTAEEFLMWLGFGGTVLGAGGNVLAMANTPKE